MNGLTTTISSGFFWISEYFEFNRNKQTKCYEYSNCFSGIQVEWKNKKGESALWLAAKHNHSFSVKLLHHARADFLSKDHSGLSCLSIAFKKGHVRLVEWLLHHMKCDRVNGLTCDTRCHRITDRRLKEILLKGPDQ